MTQAKDELFCRLALRQGLLTKEDATAVLRGYRAEARSGEGIGAFVVRNGYLDKGIVSTLEGAIARRAEGHVADTRRRVPKRGKSASHSPATRATHRVASRGPKASGAQVAMVAIAGVVFIGAILGIAFQFTSGSQDNNNTANDSSDEVPTLSDDPVKKLNSKLLEEQVVVTLNEQDIQSYRDRMESAKAGAIIESGDEKFGAAIDLLRRGIRELGGDRAPVQIQDLVKELRTLEADFVGIRDSEYTKLVEELGKVDEEDKIMVLEEIERKCGVEKRREAEGASAEGSDKSADSSG